MAKSVSNANSVTHALWTFERDSRGQATGSTCAAHSFLTTAQLSASSPASAHPQPVLTVTPLASNSGSDYKTFQAQEQVLDKALVGVVSFYDPGTSVTFPISQYPP